MSWLGLTHKIAEPLYPDEWNLVVDGLDILKNYIDSEKARFFYGVGEFDGNGSTTEFVVSNHGVPDITDPREYIVVVTPASQDAINSSPVFGYLSDEDNDGVYEALRIKFSSPPPSGTKNVVVVWKLEKRP